VAHPASYPISTGGCFPANKAAGPWDWPLTSSWCRAQEYAYLCSHSPIRLHGIVLNEYVLAERYGWRISYAFLQLQVSSLSWVIIRGKKSKQQSCRQESDECATKRSMYGEDGVVLGSKEKRHESRRRLLECGKSGWWWGEMRTAGSAVHFHPPWYGRCYLSKSSLSIFLYPALFILRVPFFI
jgi:hypothetical protein